MQRSAPLQPKLAKTQSLRQRITPTFLHQPIFNHQPSSRPKTRFTPTFASTAFDCQGYSIATVHCKKVNNPPPSTVVASSTYRNVSKHRKQMQFNTCHNQDPHSPQYYDLKDQLMQETQHHGSRTSRVRKMLELMSNPIFAPPYIYLPQPHHPTPPQPTGAYIKQNYQLQTGARKEGIAADTAQTEQHLPSNPKEEKLDSNGQKDSSKAVFVKGGSKGEAKRKKSTLQSKGKTSRQQAKTGRQQGKGGVVRNQRK